MIRPQRDKMVRRPVMAKSPKIERLEMKKLKSRKKEDK